MKIYKWIVAGGLAWTLFQPAGANAQSPRTIDPGTTIAVRTHEEIRTTRSDGRVYSGEVARDVMNRAGRIAIPRGSNVELLVRNLSRDEIALDLEAVYVRGERYGIDAEDTVSGGNDMGANKKTGEFVGGGAAIGAIIGAIAGGGKGAIVGGGVGAIAGANAQLMTRGREVEIPPESLVTFQLAQPLRLGAGDRGYIRDGQHYHPGYEAPPPPPEEPQQHAPSLQIGGDHNIIWDGAPPNARVYAQTDNSPTKLFATGGSGKSMAPWIVPGHVYTFILQDANGNEITRQQLDLRSRRNPR